MYIKSVVISVPRILSALCRHGRVLTDRLVRTYNLEVVVKIYQTLDSRDFPAGESINYSRTPIVYSNNKSWIYLDIFIKQCSLHWKVNVVFLFQNYPSMRFNVKYSDYGACAWSMGFACHLSRQLIQFQSGKKQTSLIKLKYVIK